MTDDEVTADVFYPASTDPAPPHRCVLLDPNAREGYPGFMPEGTVAYCRTCTRWSYLRQSPNGGKHWYRVRWFHLGLRRRIRRDHTRIIG